MKKVSLLLCLAFAGLSVSAQESGYSSGKPGRSATFEQNSFGSNWFVGAGGSGVVYFGDNDQHASFLDRVTVNPTLMLGKWFNPYLGGRLSMSTGSIHNFENQGTLMQHQSQASAHVDLLFNATNYWRPYNSKRFYNFIPYVGIGYAHGFRQNYKSQENNAMTVNAGFLNTFRLTDKLSFFVELSGTIVDDQFDNKVGGDWNYDGIGAATAGLTYNFGAKTTFNEAHLMDQGLVDDLNSQINKLRKENDDLRNRKLTCPPATPCPPVQNNVAASADTYVPNVVFFRLNSANIDDNQEVSIYNTAEYLKANPNAKVKIVGYADKLTGTAAYNLKLSEKRSKNVAKVLVDKYKISNDRITTEWKGSSEQPYKENAWNRVAIFFAQ